MKKHLLIVAVTGLCLLALGCSSTKKSTAASQASSAVSSVLANTSTTVGSGSSGSPSTTASGSSGGGDQSAFCAAFASLTSLGGGGETFDQKSAATAKMKDIASKIRDNAPSSIADSAKAYADLLDQAADAVNNADSQSAMTDAVRAIGKSAASQAILPVVEYAGTNCHLN